MGHLMYHIMNHLLLEIRIHLLQTFIYFFNCLFLPFSFPFYFFVVVLFLAIGFFRPCCIEFISQVCNIYLLQFYLPLTALWTKHIISFGPLRKQQMQRGQIHMEQLQRRGYVAFLLLFFENFVVKLLALLM
ncbi:hypothetical protein AMTRI_Chr13g124760 [Amborella trichopoda]